MTKAEERALKTYPEEITVAYGPLPGASGPCEFDDNKLYRTGFIKGYEQAEKDFLKKACEWLRFHASDYTWFDEITGDCGMNFDFIGDFRKVMQNEV